MVTWPVLLMLLAGFSGYAVEKLTPRGGELPATYRLRRRWSSERSWRRYLARVCTEELSRMERVEQRSSVIVNRHGREKVVPSPRRSDPLDRKVVIRHPEIAEGYTCTYRQFLDLYLEKGFSVVVDDVSGPSVMDIAEARVAAQKADQNLWERRTQ